MSAQPDVISCGCCRGPEEDRCICWNHQDVPHGRAPRVCSRHVAMQTCGVCGFVGAEDEYIPHDCYWQFRHRGVTQGSQS
jgi:hypothetical protein